MTLLINILLYFSTFYGMNNPEAANDVCISSAEKRLYNMIMDYRSEKDLYSIPLSASLTKVAQLHVRDLMEHYKLDNKCNPHSWSKKGKWTGCCYTNDHKEAACMWDKPKEIAGYESPGYEIVAWRMPEATPEDALQGWKKSKGHNPLLINSGMWAKAKWNAIGMGIYGNYAAVWFGEKQDPVSNIPLCKE